MKITFKINYRTNWGEAVYVYGDILELGGGDPLKAVKMDMVDASMWQLDMSIDSKQKEFKYNYVVKAENQPWRFEWGTPHVWRPASKARDYEMIDFWNDVPADKPFYSSAFVEGMLSRRERKPLPAIGGGSLVIRVFAPVVAPDEVVAISGEADALGNWDPEKAVELSDANYPQWECAVSLKGMEFPFQYKFLIKKKTGAIAAWENRDNRICYCNPGDDKSVVAISGLRLVNPKANWKGAGTAIPVFSIRSEEDFGAGDFYDLKKMVDWCAATGQKVLQLLPVNDTTMTGTWTDSYPYNANSTFALHPMYIRLSEVGKLKSAARQKYYDNMAKELNALPEVDYERVNQGKIAFMREIFAEKRSVTEHTKTYRQFLESNLYWLKPYAAFCLLRDINSTPDMSRWGEYAVYDEAKVEALMENHKTEIAFVYYLQYHLDKQLREVRNYAHQNGVVLKGDIPIGISRTSADAWVNPRLFNMNCQAGAPPDDFSVLGQNWGFPTYNWEEMARDGFAWWKSRFRKMSEYFDAYRIDHILGFFRIWQIPMDAVHGLLGIFNPALPYHPDEMRNNYDFWLDVDLQTNPLIMEWMLGDFFGEYTAEAKERFLDHIVDGRYRLKPYVNTQAKVAEFFAGEDKNPKNERLCSALMGLIDDVLFIEDPYQKGKYHPRISAQFTYQYRRLNDYEKWCFDRLYNDFFYHRHNDFWWDKAMWKLPPLLDATTMLACGEDLGMIPDCVPSVMNILQIQALEIQRMPKNPKEEFGNTYAYPYYSVCTTSTHDMAGIRGWWESDPATSQRYFNHVLHEGGASPFYAEPWICSRILDMHLQSPSMLCILPLQDWLSMDGTLRRENPQEEQINIPAISRHYWRYRMHLTVEDLLAQTGFNNTVKSMIQNSGR
jgi:4-alpha-glucanotransferase